MTRRLFSFGRGIHEGTCRLHVALIMRISTTSDLDHHEPRSRQHRRPDGSLCYRRLRVIGASARPFLVSRARELPTNVESMAARGGAAVLRDQFVQC